VILNCGSRNPLTGLCLPKSFCVGGREANGPKALQEVEDFHPDLVVYSTTWPHESLSPRSRGDQKKGHSSVYPCLGYTY